MHGVCVKFIQFNICFPSTYSFPSCLFPSGFPTYAHLLPSIRATCPTNLLFLDLIDWVVFGEDYKSLCGLRNICGGKSVTRVGLSPSNSVLSCHLSSGGMEIWCLSPLYPANMGTRRWEDNRSTLVTLFSEAEGPRFLPDVTVLDSVYIP
jgi:hypothetical protein